MLYANYVATKTPATVPQLKSKVVDGHLQGFANYFVGEKNLGFPFAFGMAVVNLKTMKAVAFSENITKTYRVEDAIRFCKRM